MKSKTFSLPLLAFAAAIATEDNGATNTQHPITNSNIHHAVKSWMKNRDETMNRFGHIQDWDTSRVTDMSDLFSSLRHPSLAQFRENITGWDVSRVTKMSYLFCGNAAMNLDLSRWNVSNVVDASHAFANTKHYNGHGIGSWDVSKLVNASNMFHDSLAFDSHGVHQWDVRSLVDASRMFHATKSFTGTNQKWKWNSHNLKDMTEMFAHAISFAGDVSDLNVSNVHYMTGTFFKAVQFNGDVSTWKTDNVQDLNSMFAYAASFEGKGGLKEWNVGKVTTMANMFKRTPFHGDLSNWNVEAATDIRNMFRYAPNMDEKVCWTLNKQVNVDGIFFQSNGHFDRSCVKHKFVVQSCCRPNIDNACRCGETTINEDHEVAQVSQQGEGGNSKKTDPSIGGTTTHTEKPPGGAVGATNSLSSSFLDKTQYLMVIGIASIAVSMTLLVFAIRKFRLRNTITTTMIDCGGADDLDVSDLDIPSPSRSSPFSGDNNSTSLTVASTNSSREEEEDHGPMEDIPVREII